jgi:hypothetical protein
MWKNALQDGVDVGKAAVGVTSFVRLTSIEQGSPPRLAIAVVTFIHIVNMLAVRVVASQPKRCMVDAMEENLSTEKTKETRSFSTIAFPYLALDEAITIAKAVTQLGGGAVERDQLGAQMGRSKSGCPEALNHGVPRTESCPLSGGELGHAIRRDGREDRLQISVKYGEKLRRICALRGAASESDEG